MSESIYSEVERAIREKLHVGVYIEGLFPSPWIWRYPDHIELGNIIMRDSDCGLAKPTCVWTTDDWAEKVAAGGLWRKVGIWTFVRADDPAASAIRYAHTSPDSAGRELHTIRARIAELERERDETLAILAHTDIGSLPDDWTLRMVAEARIDDLIKLRDQVRDTCARAERAEAEVARHTKALVRIKESYEARADLYTNDADCAGNLYDIARSALGKEKK